MSVERAHCILLILFILSTFPALIHPQEAQEVSSKVR